MTIEEMIKGIRELAVRAIDDESRTVDFVGVTETVASDGGILTVNGANWERLDKNPVVMWSHSGEVVGRIVKRKIDRKAKEVTFSVEFAKPEVSEFADSKFRLVKAGFLRAASIGFIVDEFERNLTDKEREKLGLGKWGWVARKWTPYELSIVAVGADPNAIKRAIALGELREEDFADPEQDMSAESHVSNERDESDIAEALDENSAEQRRTQQALERVARELSDLVDVLQRNEDTTDSDSGDEPDESAADSTDEIQRKLEDLTRKIMNMEKQNA